MTLIEKCLVYYLFLFLIIKKQLFKYIFSALKQVNFSFGVFKKYIFIINFK